MSQSEFNPEAVWEVRWLSSVDYTVYTLEVQAPNAELANSFTLRTLWQVEGIPQDKLSHMATRRLD